MKVFQYLSVLASTLVLASTGYAAGQHSFIKRLDTSRVLDLKGAILFKGDTATTCEVALVSNLIGYVSANCLDYQDGTTTLTSTTSYSVMIADSGTTNLGKFNIDTITVHPKYDPKTFANNLALLQFNTGNPIQFKNYIAANEEDWMSTMYSRRGVVTGSPNSWAVPDVVNGSASAPDKCAEVSTLYGANTKDFACTEQVLVSDQEGKKCAAPYSSIYGVHDPDLAIAGLYSHSVIIGGDNLCGYTQVYNFYTLLSNYLEWGGNTAESTMYLYVANNNYLNNVVSGYSMTVPANAPAVSGVVVGGDLSTIAILGTLPADSVASSTESSSASSSEKPAAPSSSEEPASSETPAEGEGLDPANSNSAQTTEEKGKKSNIVTIIIIVLAVLAVLAILAFLWWRRRKNQKKKQNTNIIDMNNYMDGAQINHLSFIGGDNSDRKHLEKEIHDSNRYSSYSTDSNAYGANGFIPKRSPNRDEKRPENYAW
ncbi:hypothetical protein FB645_002913 [Coemansia sp. IMI 203386]|nr:hypothetical protein FB645_002913 [Coemansia sp. IMI 203386]